jgi:hypothetical protein
MPYFEVVVTIASGVKLAVRATFQIRPQICLIQPFLTAQAPKKIDNDNYNHWETGNVIGIEDFKK